MNEVILFSDDDSDTAIEGEENIRALELRKQEVRLQPQRHRQDTDTGSDTEVRLMNFQYDIESDDRSSKANDDISASSKIESENEYIPKWSGFSRNNEKLQRSTTFCKPSNGTPACNIPLIKSQTTSRIDQITDCKSSAPFEEKLVMFGSISNRRRNSTLDTLLKNDLKEIQKCRQDNEINEEKYIDRELVSRRESLRKTNVLNPKTLEFQAKVTVQDSDRHKLNFVVFRDQDYGGVRPVEGYGSFEQRREIELPPSCTEQKEDSDVEEFFQKLNLEDEEKLIEKFDEITGLDEDVNGVSEKEQEEESDLDEFFERSDVKAAFEGQAEESKREVEEILKLFENEEPLEPSCTRQSPPSNAGCKEVDLLSPLEEKDFWASIEKLNSDTASVSKEFSGAKFTESFDELIKDLEVAAKPNSPEDCDYDNLGTGPQELLPTPPVKPPRALKSRKEPPPPEIIVSDEPKTVKVTSGNLPQIEKTQTLNLDDGINFWDEINHSDEIPAVCKSPKASPRHKIFGKPSHHLKYYKKRGNSSDDEKCSLS